MADQKCDPLALTVAPCRRTEKAGLNHYAGPQNGVDKIMDRRWRVSPASEHGR